MSNAFIAIGHVNLKKSNIKSFGIYSRDKVKDQHILGLLFFGNPTVRYLSIETYQNETYNFDEADFDIDRALKILKGEKVEDPIPKPTPEPTSEWQKKVSGFFD